MVRVISTNFGDCRSWGGGGVGWVERHIQPPLWEGYGQRSMGNASSGGGFSS